MKKTFLLALLALVAPMNCLADCYSSNHVFDGRGSYGEGTLCSFGDDNAEVLPYYQRQAHSPVDYLFSEKEEMTMLKSIVNRGRYGNESSLRNAVNSASRPLRPFRSRPIGGFGF